MPLYQNKNNIDFALQAIKRNPKLFFRRAAAIYNVPVTILYNQYYSYTAKTKKTLNKQKLTKLKNKALIFLNIKYTFLFKLNF